MAGTEKTSDPLRERLQAVLGGEFLLVKELGGGGMSHVYAGEQPALGRSIVVKVLPRELADDEAIARFRREIELVAALQHPQIVPIIAAGDVDGLPYFVMPYFDAESLRARLWRGPLGVRETVAILLDVTRALVHAHDRGVVHRDIKPDNILLATESAVVSDFGIARAIAGSKKRRPLRAAVGEVTSEGMSLGTPTYMAPEQIAADPDVDHRADLYALGIVAYEMLAGAPPFREGSPQKILAAQLTEPPPPLSRRRADVPVRLDVLIRLCLEKDPGARPASAAAVLSSLQDPELLTATRPVSTSRTPVNTPSAMRWLESIGQDVSSAARGLRLRPGFVASIATTLALAMGANSTMFSLLDRLFLRPPVGVQDPDRVVRLTARREGRPQVRGSFSYVNIDDFRRSVPGFAAVAGVTSVRNTRADVSLGAGENATNVRVAIASGNYFGTLGVRPVIGRLFQDSDDDESNPEKGAVIAYGLWQRRFTGSRDVLGQILEIAGQQFRILGVAPQGFSGIELDAVDVWIPFEAAGGLRFDRRADWRVNRSTTWVHLVARLAPEADPRQAAAQATLTLRTFERERLTSSSARADQLAAVDSSSMELVSLTPGKSLAMYAPTDLPRDVWVAKLLLAMSVVVLLAACANVANLLLVRALRRRKEIAIRLALGISGRRLVRQLLAEGMLLAGLGAAGAFVVALWGSSAVRGLLFGETPWASTVIDGRMLGFTAIVALLTGVLTSIAPVLFVRRTELTSALKSGTREGTGHSSRVHGALVFVQATLAVVLLVGAGLFVRSIRNATTLPVGVDLDRVVVGRVAFATDGPATAEGERAKRRLFDQFVDRAREVPGVESAAITVALPFEDSWNNSVFVPGRTLPRTAENPTQYAVTPTYFETMGVRLLQGRLFIAPDRLGAERVVVINDVGARAWWPNESPLGQCLRIGADTMPCRTVVGVVTATRRQALVEGPTPQVYVPLDQLSDFELQRTVGFLGYVLVVRTAGNAAARVVDVRRAMQSAAPGVPYPRVRTMRELTARHTRQLSIGAQLFTAFGGLALVLAVVGLYGVISYSTAQRMREYGVRSALGAQRADILQITMGRGLIPVVAGLITGVVFAIFGGRVVGSLLFDVSPRDPAILMASAALLLIAATFACLIPAIRASRVDPAIVLKAE